MPPIDPKKRHSITTEKDWKERRGEPRPTKGFKKKKKMKGTPQNNPLKETSKFLQHFKKKPTNKRFLQKYGDRASDVLNQKDPQRFKGLKKKKMKGTPQTHKEKPTNQWSPNRKMFNIGGRANLLEEMGRIDSEKMNPNRRAEKKRVIGELNRGYKKGGLIKGKPKLAKRGWK